MAAAALTERALGQRFAFLGRRHAAASTDNAMKRPKLPFREVSRGLNNA